MPFPDCTKSLRCLVLIVPFHCNKKRENLRSRAALYFGTPAFDHRGILIFPELPVTLLSNNVAFLEADWAVRRITRHRSPIIPPGHVYCLKATVAFKVGGGGQISPLTFPTLRLCTVVYVAYGLFNGAVNSSSYVASNDRMINE
jgi:hypothetical protein